MSAQFIAEAAALDDLCRELANASWIALDTEFRRVDTYYAQLCLIQVATPRMIASVDPLAVDIKPLLAVLARGTILKVLHAARQDLEVINDLAGQVPAPVFDTQIAAAFTGFPDQVGYATVVEAIAGSQLDKSQTRTDWSRRPLTAAQLAYAADDVRHLRVVYTTLEERLAALGRRAWLEEECAALTDPALYANGPEQAWRRLGAAASLPPRAQTVLAEVAAWRERTAQALNRPRGWILKDATVVEIANRAPRSLPELAAIADIAPATIRHRGEEILSVVRRALELPPARLAEPPVRFNNEQQTRLKRAAERVAQTAARLNIPASLLATRQDLQALLLGRSETRVLRGWRRAVIGEELADLVAVNSQD
jgi:ribonuclease D